MIAEKCPRCWRKAEIKGRLSDCLDEFERIKVGCQVPAITKRTAVVCWCGKCRRYFEQGEGGRQLEICQECSPKQMELVAGSKSPRVEESKGKSEDIRQKTADKESMK